MSRQAVATLEGAALAWAVAVAEGRAPILLPPTYGLPWRVAVIEAGRLIAWRPERDPAQGHELIERHKVELLAVFYGEGWFARHRKRSCDGDQQFGETALVAACRAVSAAELGKVVELPPELAPVAAAA